VVESPTFVQPDHGPLMLLAVAYLAWLGFQEVDAVAFEHGRGLAGGVVPEVADQCLNLEVVGGEAVDLQVAVLVGRRDHVRGPAVVVERDVAGHVLVERAEAAVVRVRAVDRRRRGHRRPGLAVVRPVLLVHPHDVAPGRRVPDHLGPLDLGAAQFGRRRRGEHVVAELPVAQVGRPVHRDGPERVVGVAVLTEPVPVGPGLQDAAAVGVHPGSGRVGELNAVGDRDGCGLRRCGQHQDQ
jgi:hypothetical protein